MKSILISDPLHIRQLRLIIEVLANFFKGTERLTFTKEGIEFESMKQGSVFIYFTLKKSFFKEYDIGEQSFEYWLDVADLQKVLSSTLFECNTQANFKIDCNTSSLDCSIGSELTFVIPRRNNPNEDDSKKNISEIIRNIPLDCNIQLQPTKFESILNNTKVVFEKIDTDCHCHLDIEVKFNEEKPRKVTFRPQRHKTDLYVFQKIVDSEENKIRIGWATSDILSSYDFEELLHLEKIASISKNIQIDFDSDKPIRIDFHISEHIDFCYVMAPLVEEKDEEEDLNSE